MKVTVSIPDQIVRRAEARAKVQGVSRSELYARALEVHLARHELEGMTARLNAVYSAEESALSSEVRELSFEALRAVEAHI